MCGIAGIFRPDGGSGDALLQSVKAMTATLFHRGPDRGDVWADPKGKIGFGHRRLSILDLSDAGSQPMRTECGRFTVTFNGEIYNHQEIRSELERVGGAPCWRGLSDTETLLYAVRQWGIEAALRRFNGMFAFALWDAQRQLLTLCRDRFGEKPLFYGWIGENLVFASELKAMSRAPGWETTIDRSAMTAFMRYSYIPAPWTVWKGIKKLVPGSFLTIDGQARTRHLDQPRPFWSMRECIVAGQRDKLDDPVAATDELEHALSLAVRRQLISDVPLGAFLSGGIDSSTIVALMQRQASQRVRTFSIGFSEAAFNEADHARQVADYLGTDHTEMIVSPTDAQSVIPRLADLCDEPYADSSQIPMLLVSSLARRSVVVSLSGDGGDELFGGYNRHVWGERLLTRFSALPGVARHALEATLRLMAPEPANTLALAAGRWLPKKYHVYRAGDKIVKIARILESASFDEMYLNLTSIDDEPTATLIGGEEPECWASKEAGLIGEPLQALDRMTLSDATSYLPDDILQKVDRASMSVSLEARAPFLDQQVAELSCRIPTSMKLRAGQGKWIVRQVLARHVPDKLTNRPKAGFSIPLDDWLRGPLRAWASDLLSRSRLERQGLFDASRVARFWSEHERMSHNHGSWLWNVLMAQSWADRWLKPMQ
jgi:asparagine synthase (glutamine-hydrolysing)